MKRALAAAVVLLALPLFAAEKPFSLEDVMSAPFISGLVSANVQLAWIANERGVRNVWVAEGPRYDARQVTKFTGDDGIDLGELTLSHDGRWLAFTRGGDQEIGAENPNPASFASTPEQHVFTVSIRDNAVHDIGEGHDPAISPNGDRVAFVAKKELMLAPLDGSAKAQALIAANGTRHTLRWSPDGTRIAFVAPRKEHAFIGIVDVATKAIRYLDPSVDRDLDPTWSPDGKQVAFVRIPARDEILAFAPERTAQPWSIRIADAATGRGRELWRADEGPGSVFHGPEQHDALLWSANRIVFPWEKDGWLHLYSIAPSGGSPRLLTPGDGEVQHAAVASNTVVYSSNQNDIDRRHLWRAPIDGSEKPAQITTGKTIEWSPLPIDDGKLAFIRSDAMHPGRVFVNEQPLTTLGRDFPKDLVEPQQVIFTASDGLPIHAQLFLPREGAARHPAVVFFHGGSRRQMLLGWHYMGYYANAYAMNQYLASRGYVVLSVNYRSGIGYGLNFREALNYGTRGASEVNDVTGAALYLRTRSDVDPKRIAAWGGSYGGYLTAFALAKSSDLYAAGVDLHGVHDWNNEIRVWMPAYDPAKNADFARLAWASSPMAYVDTWRSPVLLIQGDDDRNVSFTETIHLAEKLRERKVHVETLVLPDEIHDFLMHRSWLAAYHAAEEFLGRMLSSIYAER